MSLPKLKPKNIQALLKGCKSAGLKKRATNIRIKIQLDNVRSQVSLAINA